MYILVNLFKNAHYKLTQGDDDQTQTFKVTDMIRMRFTSLQSKGGKQSNYCRRMKIQWDC